MLKPSLGAGADVSLARSTYVTVSPATLAGWVDFDFTTPATVTAGQEYFIELQGNPFPYWPFTSGNTYYDSAVWAYGVVYPDGRSYRRFGGIWEQVDDSLAFRTFVDANPDIVTAIPTNGLSMHGSATFAPKINLTNITSNSWEPCTIAYGNDQIFSSYYNSVDFNCTKTVTNGSSYYDQNGWITANAMISSSEAAKTQLVTDQFNITFNRILNTVTDANGSYSFTNLPDGNYTITVEKPTFLTQTSNGIIAPGQTIAVDAISLVNAPPASLQGTVSLNTGAGIPGVTVTITDRLGTKSTLTESQGNYLISGVVDGNYTITFSGQNLQSVTKSGTLSPGENGVLNIYIYALPITLNITSPITGSVVSTTLLTITGNVLNAESVIIYKYIYDRYGNQIKIDYPAIIVNETFSVTVPLTAGQTSFGIKATTQFTQYYGNGINITRTPFAFNFLGDSGNVAIAEVDGSFDGKNPDGTYNDQPRKAIATEYFKNHADTDFLVFLSTFDYAMPEATAQGFYTPVKNDTQGINQAIINNTAAFGSPGRLQGTIDLGNISTLAANPYGPKLDETLTVLNHELMHRFGSYVRFKNQDGTLNTALLGKDSAHWSYLLDSKGSLMYGNGWKNNGDGTFTATAKQSAYSPLDLYLMGMIPKDQVPPMLLIDNPAIDKTQLPQLGAAISGTAKAVTIDDIIAAEGPRIPDSTSSQKQFNVGFVLLTRAGDNSTSAVQAIETLRKAWAGRFAELTQGKGSMANIPASLEVTVDSPVDGATITGPDVTVSGMVINTSGVETGVTANGMPATVSGNRFIANHVPLQLGSNTLTVTATDANGLTAMTSKGVMVQAGNYIRISSNIESGTSPLNISLRLDGSFSIVSPQVSYSGPVPVTLTPGTSSTEYTTTLTVEGTYTFTASVVGPDGQVYSDTVTITVISMQYMDTLLQSKWSGMKAAMATSDITKALSFVSETARIKYQPVYQALSAYLPEIAAGMRTIEYDHISQNRAEYRISRTETINSQPVEINYYIYFSRDKDGLWKINVM